MTIVSRIISSISAKLKNDIPKNKPNRPPIPETKSTISILASFDI